MKLDKRSLAAILIAVVTGIGGVLLLIVDVYVDRSDEASGTRAAMCGSAYDVVFIKHDGYMGGEYAVDQDAFDASCVNEAENYAYPGAVAVVLAAVCVGYVAVRASQAQTEPNRGLS